MCDLGLEVRGQIDDVDGVEGAFLGADTAANTQALRDEGDLGGRVDFDAQLARADHGTGLFTFLAAFLAGVRAGGMERMGTLALGLHCERGHSRVSQGQISRRQREG